MSPDTRSRPGDEIVARLAETGFWTMLGGAWCKGSPRHDGAGSEVGPQLSLLRDLVVPVDKFAHGGLTNGGQ